MQKISISASARTLEIWQKKWGGKKKTLHLSIPFKVSVNESAYFPFMHLLKNLPGYQPFVPAELSLFVFFGWGLMYESSKGRKCTIFHADGGNSEFTIQLWPAASSARDAAVKPWVSSCSSLCVSIFTLSVYAPPSPPKAVITTPTLQTVT